MNLKPCPFCSSVEIQPMQNDAAEVFMICTNCHAQGPKVFEYTEKGVEQALHIAVRKWNQALSEGIRLE